MLKCDGDNPKCGHCTRLLHKCSYQATRRKSGPKPGYVKVLQDRVEELESLLEKHQQASGLTDSRGERYHETETTDARSEGQSTADSPTESYQVPPTKRLGEFARRLPTNMAISDVETFRSALNQLNMRQSEDSPEAMFPSSSAFAHSGSVSADEMSSRHISSLEIADLGLDEALPSPNIVADLDFIYFQAIHPSLPMIHRSRYMGSINLLPVLRPPVCLRYAMWCNAAATLNKYKALQNCLYQRARKYLERDEMRGFGENIISLAHCQAWVLLCQFEFKSMYFPRAWMSSGRAVRSSQMMGLHLNDAGSSTAKIALPLARDWVESEERRRTFWGCFCVDRYSSIGTGWPMNIDERDIEIALPGYDEIFESGQKPLQPALTLQQAFEPGGPNRVSPFGGLIMAAAVFGRNTIHLHRCYQSRTKFSSAQSSSEAFWADHQEIDNDLTEIMLLLPDRLQVRASSFTPMKVLVNMLLYASTICLHRAAILRLDDSRALFTEESKARCTTAAGQIASIMRQAGHLNCSTVSFDTMPR